MASGDQPLETKGERAKAVKRLTEVVTERRRLSDKKAVARDTSGKRRPKTARGKRVATP